MDESFKKRLWIGGGVILGSVALAFAGFYFLSNAITAEADRVVAQKVAVRDDANSLAALAALETAAPQAVKYDAAIQKLLPDQSGLITFNSWMTQASKNYNVLATVAYQGDPTPASTGVPGSVRFTMTAQGQENGIAPFLDYISSNAPGFMLSFDSFDFTNDQSQESIIAQGTMYFR